MEALNWLLINVAEAAIGLWSLIKVVFGTLFTAISDLLNPFLAPILGLLNPICTAIGDVVYVALSPFPTWVGLTVISVVTGVVMLIGFRYLSNQEAIRRTKDEIKANLLTLRLFKDELRVTLAAQLKLLWALVKLQRYILPPVLIMMPPMLLGLAQMGVRYQWRPLRTNEQTLLTMHVTPAGDALGDPVLESNTALIVEAGPVPGGGRVDWRVRGGKPGRHTLQIRFGEHVVTKEVVVGESLQRVSAERPDRRWTAMLLHPTESTLPSGAPIESVEIRYPPVDSYIHGANWWIGYFFIVSMLAALIFKPVFGVTF